MLILSVMRILTRRKQFCVVWWMNGFHILEGQFIYTKNAFVISLMTKKYHIIQMSTVCSFDFVGLWFKVGWGGDFFFPIPSSLSNPPPPPHRKCEQFVYLNIYISVYSAVFSLQHSMDYRGIITKLNLCYKHIIVNSYLQTEITIMHYIITYSLR